MTINADQWLDPMIVLERKQEAQARKKSQCGGCVRSTTALFKGEPACTLKYQTYGYRCQFFQLKDAK